jgi:hypothetical protein
VVSRPDAFADVRRRVTEYGPRATLVTITAEGLPHVVSVVIELDGDRLVAGIGPRTADNLAVQAGCTLTWPPADGGEFQLILDGRAEEIGEPDDAGVRRVSLSIARGILHRLPELPEPGPSCVVLSDG